MTSLQTQKLSRVLFRSRKYLERKTRHNNTFIVPNICLHEEVIVQMKWTRACRNYFEMSHLIGHHPKRIDWLNTMWSEFDSLV